MAYTIKAKQYDGLKGAAVEVGKFTLYPALNFGVISNGAEVEISASTGFSAAVGDSVFVSSEALTTGLVLTGARVNGAGAVTVTLYNYTAAPITDSTGTVFDYLIYHYTTAGS